MARYLTFLLAALCMAATARSLAGQQKFSPAEQEVLNVRAARIEAIERRDLAAWSQMSVSLPVEKAFSLGISGASRFPAMPEATRPVISIIALTDRKSMQRRSTEQ